MFFCFFFSVETVKSETGTIWKVWKSFVKGEALKIALGQETGGQKLEC